MSMGVKLSKDGLVGLFNLVSHLLRPSIPVDLWRCLPSILCGVVSFGVVGLTPPLVSVKLTSIWVRTTFLRNV